MAISNTVTPPLILTAGELLKSYFGENPDYPAVLASCINPQIPDAIKKQAPPSRDFWSFYLTDSRYDTVHAAVQRTRSVVLQGAHIDPVSVEFISDSLGIPYDNYSPVETFKYQMGWLTKLVDVYDTIESKLLQAGFSPEDPNALIGGSFKKVWPIFDSWKSDYDSFSTRAIWATKFAIDDLDFDWITKSKISFFTQEVYDRLDQVVDAETQKIHAKVSALYA